MSECNGAGFLIDGGGIVGECAGCQKCQPKDAEIARLTKERDSAIARAERAEAVMEALYAALESKDAATTITVYEIREALRRREGADLLALAHTHSEPANDAREAAVELPLIEGLETLAKATRVEGIDPDRWGEMIRLIAKEALSRYRARREGKGGGDAPTL